MELACKTVLGLTIVEIVCATRICGLLLISHCGITVIVSLLIAVGRIVARLIAKEAATLWTVFEFVEVWCGAFARVAPVETSTVVNLAFMLVNEDPSRDCVLLDRIHAAILTGGHRDEDLKPIRVFRGTGIAFIRDLSTPYIMDLDVGSEGLSNVSTCLHESISDGDTKNLDDQGVSWQSRANEHSLERITVENQSGLTESR